MSRGHRAFVPIAWWCGVFSLLVVRSSGFAFAQDAGSAVRPMVPAPRAVAGADNFLDVTYLPQRVVGAWEDRWLKLNVHVPAGAGPFPGLIFVHGGGWGGGDKDGGLYNAPPPPREAIERAVREGYVAINVNYVLGRGTRPQVFWDFRAAIRFVRAHAAEYRLDPGRIGAWGFSAGGWLASTAEFAAPEDAFRVPPAVRTLDELARKPKPEDFFLVPGDDPRPAHADRSARLSVLVADFWQGLDYLSSDDPPLLTFTGQGTEHRHAEQARAARVDFTALELTEPKYANQNSIHIPPMSAKTPRRAGGGAESTLIHEVFFWLGQRLKERPRTIPPEARPVRRSFVGKTSVVLVGASPDVEIRYTLDGRPPRDDSPVYRGPIAIAETTLIRAVAVRDGEEPSPVATFRFYREDPRPTIVEPAGPVLPQARVGVPYEVRFRSDAPSRTPVIWNQAGHLDLGKDAPNRPQGDPAGLRLDPQTGILSGTPTAVGTFTFQVQVASDKGSPADARGYVLVIAPLETNLER